MTRLGAVFGRKFRNRPASRAQDPALSEEPIGPAHVGQILRQCREHYGEDLEGVALALRIRMAYLKAIEEGRFQDLPGPTYVQGFLRAYADYLGLDSEALLKRYRANAPVPRGRSHLDFPVAPGDEARFPTTAVLFLSLILAGAAGAGWYYFAAPIQRQIANVPDAPLLGNSARVQIPPAQAPATAVVPTEQPPAVGAAQTFLPEVAQERSTAPPVVTAPPLAQPVTPPVERAPEAPPAPAVAAAPPAEQTPTPPAIDNAARLEARAPEPRGLEQPGQPAIPLPPGGGADGAARVYGQTNLDARIVIVALADSWIQVRDESRSDIFTRMLRAGDSYRVPNRPGLVMLTGNAGGLELTIDGVKAPPIGIEGEVTRDIPLDPEALKQGHAEAR